MQNQRLAILLKRAMESTITPSEREELLALMADDENKRDAERLLDDSWEQFEATDNTVLTSDKGSEMLRRIFETTGHRRPRQQLISSWLYAAASVLLIAMVSMYFYTQYRLTASSAELTLAQAAEQYNIKPGGNKAILTLGDGRVIVLDDTGNGLVAEDAGANILKSAGGQLRYDRSDDASATVTYNSIRIPKGGQYRLVLPDGSRVHLNADSYIRFPTRFVGDRREVELVGEAYFEVAHDKSKPFYVKTPRQVTRVLGTVFNISAYADETTTKTTLVEGRVEVSGKQGHPVVLKPGQAALYQDGQSEPAVIHADMDRELAWQKGYFVFNNENIKSIMQRISRWYDIDVEYQGNLMQKHFGGIFQRSKSIAQLLDSFKETGIIDFKIIERRVVVIGK
ncbi:FecR domain-containing protein [Parapedobacter lycopersici]|uniref:FecR family protein n=1 Tax=Parapedobacter lycopersici TaxID=1864939 RepID=UPI00333EF9E6